MVCFVNAFAKPSTANSASFDLSHDIRKGNWHFRDKKGFADKLSAEFYYKELSNP
jgi:hypothetical protein